MTAEFRPKTLPRQGCPRAACPETVRGSEIQQRRLTQRWLPGFPSSVTNAATSSKATLRACPF